MRFLLKHQPDLQLNSPSIKQVKHNQPTNPNCKEGRTTMDEDKNLLLESPSISKLNPNAKIFSLKKIEDISPTLSNQPLPSSLNILTQYYPTLNYQLISTSPPRYDVTLSLKPTDPDFPYDITTLDLQFSLQSITQFQLPIKFKVTNSDIPRTFAVNIESAFMNHINLTKIKRKEYLIKDSLNWLDKNLTDLLAKREATIIKFVRRTPLVNDQILNESKNDPIPSPNQITPKIIPTPTPDNERRSKELVQIQRRFRRSYQTKQESPDNIIFEIKLEPTDPDFKFKTVCNYYFLTLTVPLNYPNDGLKLSIKPGRNENNFKGFMLRNVENKFDEYAEKSINQSILHRINWLDTHLESLLMIPEPAEDIILQKKVEQNKLESVSKGWELVKQWKEKELAANLNQESGSNIRNEINEEKEKGDELEEGDYDEEDDDDEFDPTLPPPTPHCGTQLKLTGLAMNNISLLHCTSLKVEGSCQRCRSMLSLPPLTPHVPTHSQCPKCHQTLGLKFRPILAHPTQDAIGYLDTTNLILTSIPTLTLTLICTKCSNPAKDLSSFKEIPVGSDRSDQCRTCHQTLKVSIPAVKFVRLAPSSAPISDSTPSTQAQLLALNQTKRSELPCQPGQPLPLFGTCSHYRRSFRWLRFPCCNQAYPCDTCHRDLSSPPHDPIYANRQICGYCSKEATYQAHHHHPTCLSCGHQLTKSSKGKAFWEGGSGTRDQSKMSKNDSKKYANKNKTVSKKKVGPKK